MEIKTKQDRMAFVLFMLIMTLGICGGQIPIVWIIEKVTGIASKNFSENLFMSVVLLGIFLGMLVGYILWLWCISFFLTLEELKKWTKPSASKFPLKGILGRPIVRYFIQRKERQS